jgi:branched-chain amino acid aminotransferase
MLPPFRYCRKPELLRRKPELLRRSLASSAPIGSANLAWKGLGFNARETAAVVKYNWADGKWDGGEVSADPYVSIHLLSHCLNFGQSIFEGLKVFHTKDGRVCAFNPLANARRLASGADRLCMPEVPAAMFLDGVERLVRSNTAYLPPYGSGGALYVRPILFGHGAEVGLVPAPRFTLALISSPVGAFFDGALQGKRALVRDDYDRAAPRGTGGFKVSGNYAPDFIVGKGTSGRGYDVTVYLDAATQSCLEEFAVANIVAVAADGTLVSPRSPSVLPSCTKTVVHRVAQELGMRTEERSIPWAEVKTLRELAACGTAVVLTPMQSITRGEEEVRFGGHSTIQRLYDRVVAIQTGECPDSLGLLHEIKL